MKVQKNKFLIIFYFLLIGLLIWLLNHVTPRIGDDISFAMMGNVSIVDNSSVLESQTIFADSFRKCVQKTVSFYNHWNGRLIPNFLAPFFLGWVGVGWFDVFNTIALLGIVFLVFILAVENKNDHVLSKMIFISFLLLLFLPMKDSSVLLKVGSCNYMIPCFFFLIFLSIFFREINVRINVLFYILLFLVAIICSVQNEAFSLPVSAALIVYFLKDRKVIKTHQIILIIGFFFGTIIVTFAPGMFSREGLEGSGLQINAYNILYTMGRMFLYARASLLLFIVIIISFIYKSSEMKIFLKDNYFYCLILLFGFGFLYLGAAIHAPMPGYSFFFTEIISIILLVKFFDLFFQSKVYNKSIIVIFLLIILLSVGYKIYINYKFKQIVERDFNFIKHSTETVVPSDFLELDRNEQVSRFLGRKDVVIALSVYLYNNLYKHDKYCVPKNELPYAKGWYNYGNLYIHPLLNTCDSIPLDINYRKTFYIPFIDYSVKSKWIVNKGFCIENKEGKRFIISQIHTKKYITKIEEIKYQE
ncbi:MAG TPA: DUF6056 family protein [Bacteroidales bacterium]|nr:DUF6056 family protein [Bacteroidales bacterium]